MPEATEDAVFLIATSFQALGRAKLGNDQTRTCNCTVVLIFAAFYIEANLTHIIDEMGDFNKMKSFVGGRNPGLYAKLSWFYNMYVRSKQSQDKDDLFTREFREELDGYFPGFEEIRDYRNNVSHGTIVKSLANYDDAIRLRGQAKDIVSELFAIAKKVGHEIPRAITYQMAISSELDEDDA